MNLVTLSFVNFNPTLTLIRSIIGVHLVADLEQIWRSTKEITYFGSFSEKPGLLKSYGIYLWMLHAEGCLIG